MTFCFPSRTEDPQCPRSSPRLSIQVSSVYCSKIDLSFYYNTPPPPPLMCQGWAFRGLWAGRGGEGGVGLPAVGMRASQGTFSSLK